MVPPRATRAIKGIVRMGTTCENPNNYPTQVVVIEVTAAHIKKGHHSPENCPVNLAVKKVIDSRRKLKIMTGACYTVFRSSNDTRLFQQNTVLFQATHPMKVTRWIENFDTFDHHRKGKKNAKPISFKLTLPTDFLDPSLRKPAKKRPVIKKMPAAKKSAKSKTKK